jgi:hypothetical protein
VEDVENDSGELKMKDKHKNTIKERASAVLKAKILPRFTLLQDNGK